MKHSFPKFRSSRVSALALRLTVALLALLMIGSLLTACGGGNTTKLSLNPTTISVTQGENAL